MAQMPIEVLDLRSRRNDLLPKAITLANRVQDQYHFSLLDDYKSYELLFYGCPPMLYFSLHFSH